MDLRTYADALETRRVIHLTGTVDEALLKGLRAQREEVFKVSPPAQVIVTLTTNGGDVDCGWVIFDELRAICQMAETSLLCLGNAHSMGVAIAMAVPRERRFASQSVSFYMHRTEITFSKKTSGGQDEQDYGLLERAAHVAFYKARQEKMLQCIATGTGIPLEAVTDLFEHPQYIVAPELVDCGFVSGIVL